MIISKLYKLLLIAIVSVISLYIISCSNSDEAPSEVGISVKIAVFSDPHYLNPALYTPGTAIDQASRGSRKMVVESEAILNSAVDMILLDKPAIVLIPGDLTKDGELLSHQMFAQIIKRLEDAGIKTYVIPGNHDVANPSSSSFSGDSKTPAISVTADEFAQIYNDYGYGESIYKDKNSLSYITEPIPGLWLICMDACRYKENTTSHVVGGRFNPQTLDWLKSKISEGKSKGKLLLGMLHHGILEHFASQKENPIGADFVVDDYKNISQEFADLGLNFVFTGHFHANDIVMAKSSKSFLYDIETGSLVTYPVPVRSIIIKESKKMEISTKYVSNINFDTKGIGFREYSRQYLVNDLDSFVAGILIDQFKIDKLIADEIAPVGVRAFLAHSEGDEIIAKDAIDLIEKYRNDNNLTIKLFMVTLESVYKDLNPADNNITINMTTGEVIK